MKSKRIIGVILVLAAGLILFLSNDKSGGLDFLAGASMAIGIGFLVGWLPFRQKKSLK